MMYFRPLTSVFRGERLDDLRHVADALIADAADDRTSLIYHLADPATRSMVATVARRFFESPLPAEFVARFGRQPLLNLTHTTIRLQAPESSETRIGWHLDLNFALDAAPFLVAWVPLEDIDETRIGLEICIPAGAVDFKALLAPWRARLANHQALTFSEDDVRTMFGDGGYRTKIMRLPAGGAAVFNQFLLHRTETSMQATNSRRSFEFRMIDLENLPRSTNYGLSVLCRPDPDSPEGIGFLAKDEGPLRPIRPDALGKLQLRRGL